MTLSRNLALAALLPATLSLTGCLDAPTYGTGTRSDVQLAKDIGNMMSISPEAKDPIDYKPRPDIVQPATTAALPAPQDSIARASGEWPETPEQRRARLRDEATANQENALYRPKIVNTGLGQVQDNRPLTKEEQRERFKAGRAIQTGAYSERRFLSDPPAELKVPAETAPVGDLGEAEAKKERRRLAEARKKKKFSLGDLWPW